MTAATSAAAAVEPGDVDREVAELAARARAQHRAGALADRLGLRSTATAAVSALSSPSEAAALGLGQLGGVGDRAGREVAGGHLGVHLDARVGRDQRVGDGHPLADLDAGRDDRVVLHVAHRDEPVDLA